MTGQTNMTITGKLRGYADQITAMEEVFGLVVDGAALTLIMPVEENKELLYQVSGRSVSYYRVSHDTGHLENLAKSQALYKHELDT